VVRAGKASIFVSGDADETERLRPLLEAIAPTVRYVGEGERARVFKLVLQVLIGGIAELLGEAVALGESAGIARKDLLDVIQDSVVGSRFTASKAGALIDDDYSATFTTLMMGKDIDLVLDLARQGGLDLPLMGELRRRLADAAEHGLAERDFIALFIRLRERAQAETKAGGNHG
jgi:3-hydroxyisobutyrate dehydrogenase-like beta-hydroxyacid dehydrogenase